MNIQLPRNVLRYLNIGMPVVTFDLLEKFDWYNDLLTKASRLTYKGAVDPDFDPGIPEQT